MTNAVIHKEPAPAARDRQAGVVLVVCLLMLIVMSLLAVAMSRNFTVQEQLAGNTREKQRALEAAESALQRAEWWLADAATKGALGTMTGSTCLGKGVKNGNDVTKISICSDDLLKPTTVPWNDRWDFKPDDMTMATSAKGGLVSATGDINYAAQPSFYIAYIGNAPSGGYLYRIHAVGWGGSSSAVAVIESVYQVSLGASSGLSSL